MNLAVFSLWTGTRGFRLTRACAMLFSAAVAFGARAFRDTELVTDIRGLEIADRLGWDCTSFSLALEKFCPPGAEHVWMLGKIQAQAIQTRPHVHVDLDLLVLNPLPRRLNGAAVIAQSKDHPLSYHDPYVRRVIEHCGIPTHVAPVNTGLVGWNDLGFCREYCEEAMRLSLHAGLECDHGGIVSIVCEQLLLAHMARERRVRIETAIPLPQHTAPDDMYDVQFAHFWGGAKQDPAWIGKAEQRFAREFPEAYDRFLLGWKLLHENPLVDRGNPSAYYAPGCCPVIGGEAALC